MPDDRRPVLDLRRRSMLKGIGAAGMASLLPVRPARAGSDLVIGDFESSLDGWTTDGGVDLARVSDSTVPTAVTTGDRALQVSGNGDPEPSIRRRIRGVDLVDHPFFVADVGVGVVGSSGDRTNATVVFRVRYRHTRAGGNARGGTGGGRPVVESPPIEVPQGYSGQLFWDMSDVAEARRADPNRLTISWHLADVGVRDQPAGRGSGPGYDGDVFLDNVRFTDARGEVVTGAIRRQITLLKAEHGSYEYRFESADDLAEHGRLSFFDGTEVPVTLRATAEGARLDVGDETYEFEVRST